MRIISAPDLATSPQLYQDIAETLANDGIVCFPSGSSYRLATRMMSERAVIKFMQVKRRTKKAPALIFIHRKEDLQGLVEEIPDSAEPLMKQFWPGPLTLQFQLSEALPRKLARNLSRSGKVGIRIPQDPVVQTILEQINEPLLISSANLANKKGSHSEAQIRKNFGRDVSILISAGDLSARGCSTVVDITVVPPAIKRSGTIEEEQIVRLWSSEGAAANVGHEALPSLL